MNFRTIITAAVALLALLATGGALRAQSVEPTLDPALSVHGVLQFSVNSYTLHDNVGAATITVTRAGGAAGMVEVDYTTQNGTALSGADYVAAKGTLVFGPGVRMRTFLIRTVKAPAPHGGETLFVQLSKPAGGATLGSPGKAVVAIVQDSLALAPRAANPGQAITLTGRFDPAAATYVVFTDLEGDEVSVRTESVTATKVVATTPVFLGPGFSPDGNTVAVEVVQAGTVFGPVENFKIGALPDTGQPAGTFLLAFLAAAEKVTTGDEAAWLAIQKQSNGAVDTSALQNCLKTNNTLLAKYYTEVRQLMNGQVASIPLGKVGARDVEMDKTGLALLDQILVSLVFEGNLPTSSAALAREGLSTAVTTAAEEPVDILPPFKDKLDAIDGTLYTNTTAIFALADKISNIGNVVVGMARAGAILLANCPAAEVVEAVEPVGQAILLATTVMPAIASYAVYSMASPFVELELGHPPDEKIYEPAQEAFWKGAVDTVKEEALGGLIKTTFPLVGADAGLVQIGLGAVTTGLAALGLIEPDKPASLTQKAYNNSTAIFDNRPMAMLSIDDVDITAPAKGYVDASFYVMLSVKSSEDVKVNYITVAGTAPDGDYIPKAGTLTIAGGEPGNFIRIPVLPGVGPVPEPNDTFSVVLSDPVNAKLGQHVGVCTIHHTPPPPVTYTVTTSSSPDAGGSTSGGGKLDKGTTATVVATAASGYSFANWTKEGVVVSSAASYQFTVTADVDLVAHFTLNPVTPSITITSVVSTITDVTSLWTDYSVTVQGTTVGTPGEDGYQAGYGNFGFINNELLTSPENWSFTFQYTQFGNDDGTSSSTYVIFADEYDPSNDLISSASRDITFTN
jgi:hypothetical protein